METALTTFAGLLPLIIIVILFFGADWIESLIANHRAIKMRELDIREKEAEARIQNQQKN